jgi:signal transduction histidine kinase
MRETTRWIRGTLAGRSEAEEQPRGKVAFGTVLHDTFSARAKHRLLVVPDGRQQLIGGGDWPTHDLEDKTATAALFVGSATEPSPGASKRAFDVVRNIDSSGPVEILYSSVCDITPRTRLLRRVRRRVKALTTANRRNDEFLATLSHELRGPLASIQNAVYLLNSATGESPARLGAQALIERQVRRMTRLADDLLDVSRISHGRLRLRRERIDLRLVLSNAIETLQSDIKERNHRLAVELPDAPVWLQADPWRLEQVFVNLLANASKYTDVGGELAAWMHTRDGQVVVRIRDSGIGIASEALPHIFDLFRQTDEAAACSRSGRGIGLALVRNLVESHGGRVTAASAGLGKGSEFTVRLPRSREAATIT